MSQQRSIEISISVYYNQVPESGYPYAGKKDLFFRDEDKAKVWLSEAHAAAKIQDRKWIMDLVGYCTKGPLVRVDFNIGDCFHTEIITNFKVLEVPEQVDYTKVHVPYRVLQHSYSGGAGRFYKFRGW